MPIDGCGEKAIPIQPKLVVLYLAMVANGLVPMGRFVCDFEDGSASFAARGMRVPHSKKKLRGGNDNFTMKSGATEEEATGGRTSRVGRPRGGMRVAARIGDRLRREIRRGRRPRVGDG